jgi:hypothetical protein
MFPWRAATMIANRHPDPTLCSAHRHIECGHRVQHRVGHQLAHHQPDVLELLGRKKIWEPI